MGALISKILALFQGSKQLNVCLIGLDHSGKTTLLSVLSLGTAVDTLPTIGMNIKTVKKENLTLKVWDLGGQQKFREYWGEQASHSDVIIFVVDSYDIDRIPEAARELKAICEDSRTHGIPLLIVANKVDLQPHASEQTLVNSLELQQIAAKRDWMIVSCSALLKKNIEGIIDFLQKHKK